MDNLLKDLEKIMSSKNDQDVTLYKLQEYHKYLESILENEEKNLRSLNEKKYFLSEKLENQATEIKFLKKEYEETCSLFKKLKEDIDLMEEETKKEEELMEEDMDKFETEYIHLCHEILADPMPKEKVLEEEAKLKVEMQMMAEEIETLTKEINAVELTIDPEEKRMIKNLEIVMYAPGVNILKLTEEENERMLEETKNIQKQIDEIEQRLARK